MVDKFCFCLHVVRMGFRTGVMRTPGRQAVLEKIRRALDGQLDNRREERRKRRSSAVMCHETHTFHNTANAERCMHMLVQDLCTDAMIEASVCVAVSSSHGAEARTKYHDLHRRTTAWNDIIKLDVPDAGTLRVTVFCREEGNGACTELASGRLLLEDLQEGFMDGRVLLHFKSHCSSIGAAESAHARLRVAVSWSRLDIEMLQKGLVPSVPRKTFVETTTPSTSFYASQPRQMVANRSRPQVADVSGEDTSASTAVTQFHLQSLRMRGRILVNKQAPFIVSSIDNAAAHMIGSQINAEGRSLAALSISSSIKLLEACSCVNSVGVIAQRMRAFLVIEDSMLVIVQNENPGTRQPSSLLEVLLFRPDAEDFARMQLLIGEGGLLIERAQLPLGPEIPDTPEQTSSLSASSASSSVTAPRDMDQLDQAQYEELSMTNLSDDDYEDEVLYNLSCCL